MRVFINKERVFEQEKFEKIGCLLYIEKESLRMMQDVYDRKKESLRII